MSDTDLNITNQFFCIEEQNRQFIFDGGSGYLFETNKLIAEILKGSKIYNLNDDKDMKKLKQELIHKYKLEEIEKAFEDLRTNNQKGLLRYSGEIYQVYEKKYEYLKANPYLNSLCLNISQKCNLGCKYCFGDGGNYGHESIIMSKEIAQKCIDYWFNNIDKDKQNFNVTFFGGEPLINKDVFIYSVNYINELFKDKKCNINYIITTNGTIIDNEIISVLKDNKFDLSISIDGIRQIHDSNRPYASGNGSFDTIVNNIKQIKHEYDQISAQITLTKRDIPFLKEATKELWDIGVNEVYSNLVFDKSDDAQYSYEDYKTYEKQVSDLRKITYENLVEGKKLVFGSLVDLMKQIHTRKCSANCFLWNQTVGIFSARGNAYRCYRYVGNEEYKLGNINEDNFSLFNNRLKKPVVRKCSECWAQIFCGDGCPYENYLYEDDINKPNEQWCAKTKILLEESFRLYIQILINKPDLFKDMFDSQTK